MSYQTLASAERVQKTVEAVQSRGINAQFVSTGAEVLEKIKALIPAGAGVMTASSISLSQIGFEDMLTSGNHPWRNLKGEMLQEKDVMKQFYLRKQNSMADVWLGSVHAVAETGEIVTASATGSQFPAYAFSSSNLIWVVGTHKIVPTLADALQRVREHSLPLEDKKQQEMGRPGSFIGKLLIFEREAPYLQRTINLIFVNEVLGY